MHTIELIPSTQTDTPQTPSESLLGNCKLLQSQLGHFWFMHLPYNLLIFKSLLTRMFLPLKSRKCATPLNIKQPHPAAHPNY